MSETTPTLSEAEQAAAEILAPLRADESELPDGLSARAMDRIYLSISSKEVIDLMTSVFVLNVCAPTLDLLIQLIAPNNNGGTKK